MGDRDEKLKSILGSQRDEVRAFLGGLSDTDLLTKTDLGWSVSQVAGHIAESPPGDTYVAKRLAQGKNATLPGFLAFVINLGNWWGTRKYKRTSRDILVKTWDTQHAKLTDYVATLTDSELDRGGVVMGMGRVTLYEYLVQSPSHARDHAKAIERALAR